METGQNYPWRVRAVPGVGLCNKIREQDEISKRPVIPIYRYHVRDTDTYCRAMFAIFG